MNTSSSHLADDSRLFEVLSESDSLSSMDGPVFFSFLFSEDQNMQY